MRIQGRINTCACPFPPPLGSWSMCWLGDLWAESLVAHSWSHMQLAHGTCPPKPQWDSKKGYTSLLMQAQGWLRILAEKRASWRYFDISKGFLENLSWWQWLRWSPPNFQSFPWQLQKELKNSDLFGGLRGPQRYVLANKLILSDKILLVHIKKVEGIWWRLGEGNKATRTCECSTHTLVLGTAIESSDSQLMWACIGLGINGIFQWLTPDLSEELNYNRVGEKYTAEGNRCY